LPNSLSQYRSMAGGQTEPAYVSSAIQDFGALIIFDAQLQQVHQVSANTPELLGISVEDCLRASGNKVLGSTLARRLRRALAMEDRTPGAFSTRRRVANRRQHLQVYAYRSGEDIVVELEPLTGTIQKRWLSVVNDWLQQIINTRSIENVRQSLADSARSLTGYDRAVLLTFDANWNATVVAESHRDELHPLLNLRYKAEDVIPHLSAFDHANVIRVNANTHVEPVTLVPERHPIKGTLTSLEQGVLRAPCPVEHDNFYQRDIGATLEIAIFSDNTFWGLLSCQNSDPGRITPSAREGVVTLTQVACQRLFLLHAQDTTRYREQVEEARSLLAEEIQRRADPQEIFQDHVTQWLSLIEASGAALVHRDTVAIHGTTPDEKEVCALTGWLCATINSFEPWSTRTLTEAPVAADIDQHRCAGLLAVPLLIDMTARGWLLFFRPEERETVIWSSKMGLQQPLETSHQELAGRSREWRAAEVGAAWDLGDELAVIISAHEISRLNENLQQQQEALSRANEHLKHLAHTDSLTGAWNRYRIEEFVDEALKAKKRYGQELSLVLFDIDHFKQINDNYGHNTGDRVLSSLAQHLGGLLRGTDRLGRWGGEEFIVVLANTPLHDAKLFAERLRQTVSEADFALDNPVTVSVGVASSRAEDSRKSLIGRADHAMYQAKSTGRNRVCVEST
jgi:chemotaxis family two-component system sensor kinase Cph1